MRISIVVGLAAALVAGAASAQDAAGEDLTLLCQGSETFLVPYAGYGYASGAYQARESAQLVVVVEGGKVRVRPPALTLPVYSKRSDDGWYTLSDVAVDKFVIRGKARLSRFDRYKLTVDRRTGAATFGAFAGICNRVADAPGATRF